MDSFGEEMKANNVKILAILDHNTMKFSGLFGENFTLNEWDLTIQNITSSDSAKKVDAWEIWNEPNAGTFWLGYMDGSPQHYFDMLKDAYPVIKAASPNALVISAGLSPNWVSLTGGNWETWLTDFNAAHPQPYFDYQGVHLYAYAETNSRIINQTKQILNVPDVWVTEVGQPSSPSQLDYSPENQATFLTANFQMLNHTTSQPVFWYQLKDEADNPNDMESNFGLYDVQNIAKPAAGAFASFTSGLK